jgi:RimJ/RimL family protein N-acetyltransferase
MAPAVRLVPWGAEDHGLLTRLVGDPAMMTHLGGPESAEQIADRQARYDGNPDSLKIVLADGDVPAGWVGYWERGGVLELGWAVLPEHQGRGVARAATAAAIERIRAERPDAVVHAFPGVENAASNGLCRSLGFTLLGAEDFEYPPGQTMRCNDWALALSA